jgi:hypothetical protein
VRWASTPRTRPEYFASSKRSRNRPRRSRASPPAWLRAQHPAPDQLLNGVQLGRPSGKIHHPVIVTARPASDPSSPGGAAAVSSGGSYAATQPSRFCTSERWVDPTLQHKNHVEILVDRPEIVVRPVGTCQG